LRDSACSGRLEEMPWHDLLSTCGGSCRRTWRAWLGCGEPAWHRCWLRGDHVVERGEVERPPVARWMLKFLAWPSVAASSQKTTCAFRKSIWSLAGVSLPLSRSAIWRMPGPPSDWYLRVGGTERAWQQSS
jgi:hypothetical protein